MNNAKLRPGKPRERDVASGRSNKCRHDHSRADSVIRREMKQITTSQFVPCHPSTENFRLVFDPGNDLPSYCEAVSSLMKEEIRALRVKSKVGAGLWGSVRARRQRDSVQP